MSVTTENPRYRLDSRIATGGMGEVWRATDTVLGREVAVKLLKTEYADDPTFRSRFQTEARNAAALHHPNVASVFDFGELPEPDGAGAGRPPRPFLVMELVRGQPLSALLRGGERMPAATAADLIAEAGDGLAAAHALGIVHRDVKPANLLVTPDRRVKITDFGIARAADAVALTQTGQVIGTPQYLSPEQAEGKPATPASDIYSLGVVLYECLAGRRPFEGDTPISTALAHLREPPPPLPDDVPAALRDAVAVALAKDPEARFRTVADFATALRSGSVVGGAAAAAPTMAAAAPTTAAAAPTTAAAGPTTADATPPDGTRMLAPPPGVPPVDERRRRRRVPGWLPWAAAAVGVIALLLVVAQLSGRDSGTGNTGTTGNTAAASPTARPTEQASAQNTRKVDETSSAPTTAKSPADDRIRVSAGDYVGRPVDDAKNDLESLGFDVEENTVDNPGTAEENTVADVSPTGLVEPGRTITLSVFDEPVPVEVSPTEDGEDGGDNSDSGDNSGKGGSGENGGGENGGGNGKGKGSGNQ